MTRKILCSILLRQPPGESLRENMGNSLTIMNDESTSMMKMKLNGNVKSTD